MRFAAPVLFVAGLVAAIVVPFFWSSRVPVLIGAALVAVAGVLAARAGQRFVWAIGGLCVAAVLLLAPGWVNDWRNGRGVAWEVPKGEYVVLAEAGIAVTGDDDVSSTLTGRDLETGKRRWVRTLPKPTRLTGQLRVQRVGKTLIVTDRNSALHALDLDTGKVRWEVLDGDGTWPMIASPEYLAVTRCDTDPCHVEARSLADGAVRWQAPVSSDSELLGTPEQDQQELPYDALWPASVVVIRAPGKNAPFEARELSSGRVLERWTGDDAVSVIGHLVVRADDDGNIRARDEIAGRDVWTRKASDGLNPVRGPSTHHKSIAMPDGGMILVSRYETLPYVSIGDTLHALDPRTGKVTDHPLDLSANAISISSTDGPAVTEQSATAGVAPLLPGLRAFTDADEDELWIDGHVYKPEDHSGSTIPLTAAQTAWTSDLHVWGLGTRRGVQVYDRRTGKRVVRFIADQARVRAIGEAIVLSEGDPETPHQYVVSAG